MKEKKRRSLADSLLELEDKMNRAGKKVENTFEQLEHRMDAAAQHVDERFERFEQKMNDRFDRADRYLQETDKKLDVILEVGNLKKHFNIRRARGATVGCKVKAVDGIDIRLIQGETLGIVGESGCGKSTIARMMIGLIPASEGYIRIFGKDIASCDKSELRAIRRRTGIVFQDPYGSLDPRMTVADIVSEPLRAYNVYPEKTERLLHTLEILESCGMCADDLFKFPHQFSGGQRQRICIARALVANPDIVVCDEAVSALDVSIQAQIINLLCDLRDARGLTYIFISHDLDVVRFIADRIAVMYLGKIVEIAPKEILFNEPSHPYTAALLQSAPVFGRRVSESLDSGEPAELLPKQETSECGCHFLPRCSSALPECADSEPSLCEVLPGHFVACHRFRSQIEESNHG